MKSIKSMYHKVIQSLIIKYLLTHNAYYYKDNYVVRVFTRDWYDTNVKSIRTK